MSSPTQQEGSTGPLTHRRWTAALPFLVGVAPLLYIWAGNASSVDAGDALPMVAVVVGVTAIGMAVLFALTGSVERASLTLAVAWLPVGSFGWQLAWLRTFNAGLEATTLLVLELSVIAVLVVLIWSTPVERFVRFLTVATALFCLTTIPGIVAGSELLGSPIRAVDGVAADGPDIYYIVLDGYGRDDVLDRWYDYDNSPFLDGLRGRGFYVADNSYSNYSMTYLSLAATLNMDYVPEELPYDYPAAERLVEDAAVIHALQRHGYQYVAFETEFWVTADAPLADVVYARGPFESEFERVVVEASLLGSVLPARGRHEVVLNTFADLADVAERPEATFTFAHLLVPHPPFMFRADGEVLPYTVDLSAGFEPGPYIEQLRFVNDRVMEMVDAIVAASDQEPVIIIQGDHGPQAFPYAPPAERYWERHGILNAMLLPDAARRLVYPSITPVNTFRVLLAGMFAEDLPLLDDRVFYNWYVSWDASYPGDHLRLFEVTDQLP